MKALKKENFHIFRKFINILIDYERDLTNLNSIIYSKDNYLIFKSLKKISTDEIVFYLKRHRVELFFYKNKIVDIILPDIQKKLEPLVLYETKKALDLSNLTIKIAQLFDKNKINYLVFKGIPLAYKTLNKLSSRGNGDLDIIVRQNQLETSIKLLELNGFYFYKPSIPKSMNSFFGRYCKWINYEARFDRKSSTGYQYVDLHWRFTGFGDSLPSFNECYQDRRILSFGKNKLSSLSYKHEFLFACSHSAKDKWMSVRNILDIDRLARKLNEGNIEITKTSNQIKMSTFVAYQFTHSDYLRKYFNEKSLITMYCLKTYQNTMRIAPKAFGVNGWTPLNRLGNVLHIFIITNSLKDWLKIILSNIITPESIVDSESREIYPIYKILLNRINSLLTALRGYFFKVN